MSSESARGEFAKILTFRDLVVYGLVYIAPIAPWVTFAYVYSLSGGAAVLAYLIGFVCMYFTAHSYKEICGEISGAGSVYAYARKAMGVGPGFVAGWMVLLDYLLVPALMYVLAAVALNTFIPGVPRGVWVLVFGAFCLAVNWFGIKTTARVNMFFLLLQLVAVIAYVVWVLAALPGSLPQKLPLDVLWSEGTTIHGLFGATSICVLSFLGFDAITTLTEEVRPEQRHLVGRSIVAVLLIIAAIAAVQTWVMSALAQGYDFGDLASGAYDMTTAKVSPVAGIAMAWGAALVTGVAVTPPMLAAVARVLHAMAEGGQLSFHLISLHPRYGVPQRALLLASAISVGVALVFIDAPDALTGIVNFGALAAYTAVHLSVIVLLGIKKRSGRWVAHMVLPAAGIAVIAAVATQMTDTARILGVSWFACGIVYYQLLSRFRRSAAEASIEGG